MPGTSDNGSRATSNSRIVRVRDLPVYYDAKTDDIYRYVPRIDDGQEKRASNSSWFQSSISQTRQSFQQFWNDHKDLRAKIAQRIKTGEVHTRAAVNYIRDDQAFLPKVGVVTVAGLGGLLLGQKGGALRKALYSSTAAIVALSACYPKQSASLLDQLAGRLQQESRSLVESKDRIFHVSKAGTVKGDYGQGTPADQHLYTTRDSAHAIVSDADKKR